MYEFRTTKPLSFPLLLLFIVVKQNQKCDRMSATTNNQPVQWENPFISFKENTKNIAYFNSCLKTTIYCRLFVNLKDFLVPTTCPTKTYTEIERKRKRKEK